MHTLGSSLKCRFKLNKFDMGPEFSISNKNPGDPGTVSP